MVTITGEGIDTNEMLVNYNFACCFKDYFIRVYVLLHGNCTIRMYQLLCSRYTAIIPNKIGGVRVALVQEVLHDELSLLSVVMLITIT